MSYTSLLILNVLVFLLLAGLLVKPLIGLWILGNEIAKAAKDEVKHEQELKQIRKEIFGDSDD